MSISKETCEKIRLSVNKLRHRLERQRLIVVEGCSSVLDRYMELAMRHRNMGYHEGKEVAYSDIVSRLRPLGDENGFGRAAAAFHRLLVEILEESRRKAQEEKHSWSENFKRLEGELRTEWRCARDKED
jgi:hypothetical protein